ncbi:YozE family protein [Parafrankia sp. BMG5.11]|uniref:YozE family protein n=1 Tax=Parafrankia sp. BMG5.11 TaxID=222540 RepID=UPI00140461DA|nr:YozE family protein [Parafrankia sp. BMG5.11]
MANLSFRGWLRLRRTDHDPIGVLARTVLADRDWPRGPGSFERYRAYFIEAGARDVEIELLRQAWHLYAYGMAAPQRAVEPRSPVLRGEGTGAPIQSGVIL